MELKAILQDLQAGNLGDKTKVGFYEFFYPKVANFLELIVENNIPLVFKNDIGGEDEKLRELREKNGVWCPRKGERIGKILISYNSGCMSEFGDVESGVVVFNVDDSKNIRMSHSGLVKVIELVERFDD